MCSVADLWSVLILDINECLKNPCHSDGFCTNTVGTFKCACKTGFSGDGFFCKGAF